MRSKLVVAGLIVLAIFFILTGCGNSGSNGSSYSSSWLGVTPDPSAKNAAVIDIRPSAVAIQPTQTISLAILVKDSYGHPVDGASIQLSSHLGGFFEDESGETEKGWFSTRFTAGSRVGTEAITVLIDGLAQTKSLLVETIPGSSPVVQVITGANSTLVDTPVTVAVGATIDGAKADGINVLLSATIPGSFYNNSGELEKGWFTTSFTPDSDASGIGTITAIVEGVIADTSLAVVKQKKESPQLSISVHPDAVFQDQTAAIIVTARDSSGFPSSSNVYLSTSLNGTFDQVSGAPEDGVFFTEFTAGKEVGSATLTVFAMDASASTILSIERPEIVAKLSPSVDRIKIEERIPVSVLVTDTYSRPISDTEVYLKASLGCECSPESGNTNEDGYLFFDLIAGDTTGTTTIRALTAGASDSADINVFGP
jgi:hypothetical protein